MRILLVLSLLVLSACAAHKEPEQNATLAQPNWSGEFKPLSVDSCAEFRRFAESRDINIQLLVEGEKYIISPYGSFYEFVEPVTLIRKRDSLNGHTLHSSDLGECFLLLSIDGEKAIYGENGSWIHPDYL